MGWVIFFNILIIWIVLSRLNSMEEKLDRLLGKEGKEDTSSRASTLNGYMEKKSEYFKKKKEELKESFHKEPKPPQEKVEELAKEELVEKEEEKPIEKEPSKNWSKGLVQSFDEFIINNFLLKIGVLIFILGVGFFLKYSIDNDLIPIWSRAFIGIFIGMLMLILAIRSLHLPKYFSASMFGGAIMILYLSIYAGYAFESFKIFSLDLAYVLMVIITLFAGFISIRFDSLSTAVFGLIGGFLTPFLIRYSAIDSTYLLAYVLLLNGAIFTIAYYKRWTLLYWLAFLSTSLVELRSIVSINRFEDNFTLFALYIMAFFLIYLVIPFLNTIKERTRFSNALVFLFVFNALFVMLKYGALFAKFHIPILYFSIIMLIIGAIFLLYTYILKRLFDNTIVVISLSQSLLLILSTPFLIFDALDLTLVLALESLILMFIGYKITERVFVVFSLIGFSLVSANVFIDLLIMISKKATLHGYVSSAAVLLVLYVAYLLMQRMEDSLLKNLSKFRASLFLVSFYMGLFLFSTIGVLSEPSEYRSFYFSYLLVLVSLFFYLHSKSEYAKRFLWGIRLLMVIYTFIFFIFATGGFFRLNYFDSKGVVVGFFFYILTLYLFSSLYLQDNKSKITNAMIVFIYGAFFILMSVVVYNFFLHYIGKNAAHIAMTISWVLFAIGSLLFALSKSMNALRIVSLIILTLAILKVFLIDLTHSSAIYKIVLFLIVGVLLFSSSYLYNKIYVKKRLDEDRLS